MKPIHHMRILKRLRGGFGTAVLLGILIPQLAVANPLGPKVISGQASFATQGRTLSVTSSDRAIINWQNFSIANGELTRFIQPTATSAVLNRVIGNNPSAIYGALQSNGRVYLVNSNGIFIGPSATIDVNGLVASTLNISDNDFKAGRMNFSSGPLAGRIENQGTIRTPAGGSIYLIAPDVTNSGIINAPNGDILLAAGQQVSLVESTTPEIAVVVSAPGNEALNLGRIIAEAGRIGIYGGLIRHRGIVSADSAVVDKTGAIHFRATNDITFDKDSMTTANGPKGGNITVQSTEGTTLVSGAVEAKGSSDKGGTIHLLGTRVGLIDAAQIDASGENGGGTILVGGDYNGKNPAVQNADRTYFGTDAIIRADAVTNGDGGKVILWGNEAMRAYGSISARGGAQGGDGGFVETSGAYLDVRRGPDVRAPRGTAGLWLLDPEDIEILSANVNITPSSPFEPMTAGPTTTLDVVTLQGALATGNVIVRTDKATPIGGADLGNITVSIPITWGTPNSLTLQANNDIIISFAITGGSGSVNAKARKDIIVSSPITTSGGAISLTANDNWSGTASGTGAIALVGTGTLNTNGVGAPAGANINLTTTGGTGGILIGRAINAGTGGSVNVNAGTTVDISGGVTASTVNVNAGTNVSITTNPINAAGGSINLTAGGSIIQDTNGLLQADSLITNSVDGTDLFKNNTVGSFSATNTGGGGIKFRSTGAGELELGNISTLSGIVELAASAGNITRTAGTISGPGLKANSFGGIGLSGSPIVTQVGTLYLTNVDAGDIYITNTGTLTTLTALNNAPGGGKINIINSGPVTTVNGTPPLIIADGDVTIIANSPLTIGTGGVRSINGNITLQAGGNPPVPGKIGDILKLDGLVKALSGNITLSAGNEIIEIVPPEVTLPAKIFKYPNLNGEAPPPTPTPTCPTGYQLVGETCQPITCPTGYQLVGNTCQVIICPTGQELVGNLCQPIACPGGKLWAGGGCQCPAGTIDYAGACKTPSIVPGTDSSTVIYFPITEELTEPLQVLVKSIINTVDPSLFRTSGSPAGGAGDDIKPKKNYCN
jgi:filamentous hemagglutinin family protein